MRHLRRGIRAAGDARRRRSARGDGGRRAAARSRLRRQEKLARKIAAAAVAQAASIVVGVVVGMQQHRLNIGDTARLGSLLARHCNGAAKNSRIGVLLGTIACVSGKRRGQRRT